MAITSRRDFLVRVGQGMFVAGVGYGTAIDLGLSPVYGGEEAPKSLTFGRLDGLVGMMHETPADKMLPKVVALLSSGTALKDLVAAAGLANAKAFGGEDYIGFHTLMALGPAYSMSQLMPSDRAALPVLKVLYRNSSRIQANGGAKAEVLRPVEGASHGSSAEKLRDRIHQRDTAGAEQSLASLVQSSPEAAYDALMQTVEEAPEVHRIVLAHRAWDMLDLVGREHALTMLRQSVRYCVKSQEWTAKNYNESRELLPKLLDQHKLLARKALGNRQVDDAWVDKMSQTIFTGTPAQAADAVAAALAEGVDPQAVGEAIALATNQLVLRDPGRAKQEGDNKAPGTVHGDSIGVHACDSAHAWRSIAKVSYLRNTCASLILAGYQAAKDRTQRGGNFLEWKPRPYQEHLEKIKAKDTAGLLAELDGAVRTNDQAQAAAVTHRYGELGFDARKLFDVLLRYATSEDGALHAEKFYRTTSDEFATARPVFKWRHAVALARVTASEHGRKAPGYEDACKLLKVQA